MRRVVLAVVIIALVGVVTAWRSPESRPNTKVLPASVVQTLVVPEVVVSTTQTPAPGPALRLKGAGGSLSRSEPSPQPAPQNPIFNGEPCSACDGPDDAVTCTDASGNTMTIGRKWAEANNVTC